MNSSAIRLGLIAAGATVAVTTAMVLGFQGPTGPSELVVHGAQSLTVSCGEQLRVTKQGDTLELPADEGHCYVEAFLSAVLLVEGELLVSPGANNCRRTGVVLSCGAGLGAR